MVDLTTTHSAAADVHGRPRYALAPIHADVRSFATLLRTQVSSTSPVRHIQTAPMLQCMFGRNGWPCKQPARPC